MSHSLVYVLGQNDESLVPTKNFGYIRKLLKRKKAKVVTTAPFTIKLLYKPKPGKRKNQLSLRVILIAKILRLIYNVSTNKLDVC
ncbi:MAG: RRXRR domain-containing protein [Desulfovibrionaceae bacterium]|nr:RRXRR domain-containing protein [Desulfovibrionaceae bacterium]